jgi:hypothetical protein
MLMLDMGVLEQEEVRTLALDTRNRVIGAAMIYRGSLNAASMRIAEVFKDAIRLNASAVIVAHNHPSGDPSPSAEDIRVTKQLAAAGKLLDIDLLDHLVIGQNRYVNLKERGLGFDRRGWIWRGALIGALMLAFGRASHLATQSLWFDEGWSWSLARMPLPEMVAMTAGDRSPALYYALLHVWLRGVGDSEFGLRFLSALADVAATAGVVVLAARLAGGGRRFAAVAAGGLYGVCAFAVWYGQEARMYALVAALCAWSSYFMLRWSTQPAWRRRERRLAGGGGPLPLLRHFPAGHFRVGGGRADARPDVWQWAEHGDWPLPPRS